ncbi:terpene synthase family protein [Streptomyces wuyuanensis]|uniref:terpene synthase family protein n=1 Tax=Streptomyces wuyuanensis TaxID=1196353 RepID=UPI00343F01BE
MPITVFHNLLYYLDEVHTSPGEESVTPATAAAAAMIKDALEVFCTGTGGLQRRITGASERAVHRACLDLGKTIRGMSPGESWFLRLSDALRDHLRAATEPLETVMSDGELDVDKFVAARASDGGMYTTIEFVEFADGYLLPDSLLYDRGIRELRRLTALISALMNDIFSYHKEVMVGRSRFNLLNVISERESCSFAEAAHLAVTQVNTLSNSFACLAEQVSAAHRGTVHAPIVDSYLTALFEQNSATYHWQWSTNRYRSPGQVFPELRVML